MNVLKSLMLQAMMLVALPNLLIAQEDYSNSSNHELSDVDDFLRAVDATDEVMIKQLLQTVDVNHKYKHGQTALHHAIPDGQASIVKLLIQSGADVNAQDDRGCTPLFEVFESLFESIAMVYVEGMQLAVPEDYYQEYILMAQYFMQSGADTTILYNYDGIEGLNCLNQTLSDILDGVKTTLRDRVKFCDVSDDEQECAKKIVTYLDKLKAVLDVRK